MHADLHGSRHPPIPILYFVLSVFSVFAVFSVLLLFHSGPASGDGVGGSEENSAADAAQPSCRAACNGREEHPASGSDHPNFKK
jgi:hypothetical protein